MKSRLFGLLIFVFAGYVVFTSAGCSSEYDYPDEPVLQYRDFLFSLNQENQVISGTLVLDFTDGDGDIGLGQGDTLPPYHYGGGHYYNFFIFLYTIESGIDVPVQFPDTTLNFHSRIPPVELAGNTKAIKGELEYTFDLQIMKPFLGSDSIRIRTWLTDRALHNSNVVVTPPIVIP
jgi:hypothetical protein